MFTEPSIGRSGFRNMLSPCAWKRLHPPAISSPVVCSKPVYIEGIGEENGHVLEIDQLLNFGFQNILLIQHKHTLGMLVVSVQGASAPAVASCVLPGPRGALGSTYPGAL